MKTAAVTMRAILFKVLFLFLMPETKAAFVSYPIFTKTPSLSKTLCWASAPVRETSKASEIMTTLKTRYATKEEQSQANAKAWSRTKNYVYQASDRLTLEQVNAVLKFLDECKCLALLAVVSPSSDFHPHSSVLLAFAPDLIKSIVTSCPRILRKDVTTQLQPTMQFLQELYGEELFHQAISRNPNLLLSSGVEEAVDNDEMDTYLQETLDMTKLKIQQLRKTAPFLFRMNVQKVDHVIQFLLDILQQGQVTDPKEQRNILCKVLTSHPVLMNLSVQTNLKPRIDFLIQKCSLQERDVATLVKSSSGIVLGLSVQDNLVPTLDFLSDLLNRQDQVDDTDNATDDKDLLRKCILRHPQLLALSIQNLQAKVDYFDAIDALDENVVVSSLACRVAIRSPAVYSLSLKKNIIPTVEFLAKAWGTLAPEIQWNGDLLVVRPSSVTSNDDNYANCTDSLSSLLKEFPSILTMSLEGNIQPTLTFFNRTGYIRLDEDFRLLGDNDKKARPIRGRYIAASLFHRLLPRWHHLIANGWPIEEEERPDPSTLPPLHLLVGATDRAFCEQLGYDYQDYVAFKEQSVPRLKFSSQFDTWLKTGRPIDIQ